MVFLQNLKVHYCSQKPTTGLHPGPDELGPHPHTLNFFNILFNIILPSYLRDFQFKFCMHLSCLPCVLHVLPGSSSLSTLIIFDKGINYEAPCYVILSILQLFS